MKPIWQNKSFHQFKMQACRDYISLFLIKKKTDIELALETSDG